MTPEQRTTLDMVSRKVRDMRQGGQPDDQIRAGLIAEGWPAAAVLRAISDDAMTRPGSVVHET